MTSYYSLSNFSHDPKLAESLGNMVVAWAHAEVVLFSTLSRVSGMGMNMSMNGYYRIPTFDSRVRFIKALAEEWNDDKFDKHAIITIIEKLTKLAATRNSWVHGDWCAPQDKSHSVVFNHRVSPSHNERRKPVKAHDVENHSATVVKNANELSDLIDQGSLLP